ncbi:protein nrt1/ ptr family 5.5 [Quercus suber]|uniref:Protein nrt1/ ptr family 5.5 n=1 Tax=Quercus suber TaxID=58331 RepID=A0AAW0LEP0_QUESU
MAECGLVLSHIMADISAVTTLQFSYLMHNWENQHLPKAAAVINNQNGLTSVLAIIVAYVADTCTGLFNMIFFSTVSHIVGLALYWISARFPSPNTNIGLFYATALAVALGRSSRVPVLKAFLAVQFRRENPNSTAACFASIISFAISNFPWATRFLISTRVMGANLLLFLSGFAFYHHERPTMTGSPLGIYFRVFRAAISKRQLNYPNIPTQYNWKDLASNQHYTNHTRQILLLPKCQFFRWLDKAALIEETSSISQEEQENLGRLCTVKQVKDVKHHLKLIPMWATLFAFGMVKLG